MVRRTLTIIVLAVLLTAVGGLLLYESERGTVDGVRPKVVLFAADDLINSLVWIAEDRGYFTRQGLDVSVRPQPSGRLALEALMNHGAGLATTAETPMVFAAFQDPDLRILATIGTADDEVRIVARRDHGIEEPADLSGKTIATQQHSAVHFFLDSFLRYHYLHRDQVNIIFLAPEEMPSALIEGKIDAYAMREPYLAPAHRALGDRAVEFHEPGLYTKSFNLVAHAKTVTDRPEVIRRVLRGLLQAEQFDRDQPNKAVEIIARLRGLSPANVQAILSDLRLEVTLSQYLLLNMEEQARWARQLGILPPDQIDFTDFVDTRPLEDVAPRRVQLFH